jgi:AcrR family transcriptional regulator
MAAVDSPAHRQRLPRAERRAQILTAAAAAFLRGGFGATSMEDVADHAGVTRLIVYRIFSSKHDLYREVLVSVTDCLRDEFIDGAAVDESRVAVASRVLRVAREHPDAFRLLWRHAAHEPSFAGEAEAFRGVVTAYAASLLHPVVHDRTFRAWAADSLVAHLYDGICIWLDDGDPARDDEFSRRMTAGLRALVTAWS